MLANPITLNDGTSDRTFAIVSQEGMNTVRSETTAGVSSTENSQVVFKHTRDPKAKTKPNRHLVAVSGTTVDANGVDRNSQVHFVITRDKLDTDAHVLELAAMAADILADPALVQLILNGGN